MHTTDQYGGDDGFAVLEDQPKANTILHVKQIPLFAAVSTEIIGVQQYIPLALAFSFTGCGEVKHFVSYLQGIILNQHISMLMEMNL